MSNFKHNLLFIFLIQLLTTTCVSQHDKYPQSQQDEIINRLPAVAGQFYAADPQTLQEDLTGLFLGAEKKKVDHVQALIVPHAGYVFSGEVAASGYNQLDLTRKYKNIFIIASSHRAYYRGASIYNLGNYETPLGELSTNQDIVSQLFAESESFHYVHEAHLSEHSIEVQLPFLQYQLGEKFNIVPIVLGTQSKQECKKIAEALRPWFNSDNLFVISSDFSHYPPYDDACIWDGKTASAIVKNSSLEFLSAINDKADDRVPNLSTRACGWTSILTLLYLTENNPQFSYQKIIYKNSGDTRYGDKERVVGYHAIALTRETGAGTSNSFVITEQDKKQLLTIARETINNYIKFGEVPNFDVNNYSENLKKKCGAFVTLNKNHYLRGCIGRFITDEPLYEVVKQMAIAASTQDSRFQPVSESELKEIEIEISVLTPLKKIESIDEIELGKHGIYIKKGYHTGTFLPQVATETGWNLDEFLGHCSRDKAGLGWDGWKNAELYIYEALVFSE